MRGKEMNEPIFFKPTYKKVVWGGNNIKTFFNRNIEEDNIGESWEISAHANGISQILNNSFNNENLADLFNDRSRRKEIFGNKCLNMDRFPILAKFIDAKQNLSIQVHPDDAYARKIENDSGKNEVWYVMDCQENAKIVYGLKEEVTKEQLNEALANNNIETKVNFVNVKKGDFITIPAGTIHAICGGLMLCEIQQSSDITYRVYDWNRIGLDGKPRKLHTEKALDVINVNNTNKIYNYYNLECNQNIYNSNNFNIDIINVKGNFTLMSNEDSFNAYIVLEGNGCIKKDEFEKNIEKGTSFLVPATLGNYEFRGNLKLMKVYI
jgi:mannose-6-phosphate isomerase